MGFISTLMSLMTAAVSAVAIFHSQSSIPKMQKYEGKAKKAAEWSNVAEKELWDTRYTLGAGLVAAAVSFISALVLIISGPSGWSPYPIVWGIMVAFGARYASQYMSTHWGKKAKVPFMTDYNEAISDSKNVMGMLDLVSVGWCTITVLKAVGL